MKKIIFIMFLLTSCSFNNDSVFWTQDSKYAFKNLEYDKDYTRLIVKCIPNIPKHVSIDDNNNIHVNIKLCVKTLLYMKYVDIFLSNKVFKIPIEELYIRQLQDYVFYKKGIPIINQDDIYSSERVSDIIVHISLH